MPKVHRSADEAAGLHLTGKGFPLRFVRRILEVFIVEAAFFRRVGDKYSADFIIVLAVYRIEGEDGMLPIIGKLSIILQLGKHLPVLHMVAI